MRESKRMQGTTRPAAKKANDTTPTATSTAVDVVQGSTAASSFSPDEVLDFLSEGGLGTSVHVTMDGYGYAWTVRSLRSMVVLA